MPWSEEELKILELTDEEQKAYNEYMSGKLKKKKKKKKKSKASKKSRRKNRK